MSSSGAVARWNSMTSLVSSYMRRETVRAASEDLVLNLVDVVLEPGDDRLVAVDDVVDDRVQDRQRAAPQQLRPRLERRTHLAELGRISVRTVITNRGPTKIATSPNTTVSVSST